MAKYRVHLQPANIWKDEIVKEVIGLNAKNAEEIALIYNKGCSIVKSIRVGKDSHITEDDLKDSVELMHCAIREGNEDVYVQQKKAFEATVASLKSHMNAVAWQKTAPLIPEIPVM